MKRMQVSSLQNAMDSSFRRSNGSSKQSYTDSRILVHRMQQTLFQYGCSWPTGILHRCYEGLTFPKILMYPSDIWWFGWRVIKHLSRPLILKAAHPSGLTRHIGSIYLSTRCSWNYSSWLHSVGIYNEEAIHAELELSHKHKPWISARAFLRKYGSQ